MAISITQTNSINTTENLPKKRSVYDNYDKLKSVVHYDSNNQVDFVLKSSNNPTGKSLETKRFQQVHVDVVESPTGISFDRAILKARIYKNDNSVVSETGFIVWESNNNSQESVLTKQKFSNIITPIVLKGNFSKQVLNLLENRTYNYRAYVTHEYGTNYSKVYQFNTIPFASVFSIAGNKFSGPAPLTVNLTGINAGTGITSYAWNMTGGPISFLYSVSGINVTNTGRGYDPELARYTLNNIVISLSGSGYNPAVNNFVLVNNVVIPSLSAEYAYNGGTDTYGISAVTIPAELSGFNVNTLNITFSALPVVTQVTTTQSNNSQTLIIDTISNDLQLARGAQGLLYNPLYDGVGNSASFAEWNNDGWGDLSDIETRTYESNITNLPNYGGNIGNVIVGDELLMRDTSTGIIYKMNFTNWQQGAGGASGNRGFAYTRTALNIPTQTVTVAASGTGSGSSYTIPREITVSINNIPQPSVSAAIGYNEQNDTYGISAINVPAEIFGFTNSSRAVTITTNDPVQIPATATAQGNIQTIADYTTQAIAHTYLSAGTFNPIVYAINGDQIVKQATRQIRAIGSGGGPVDYQAQWAGILGSSYGNSIVGAYDFRNIGNINLGKDLAAFWKLDDLNDSSANNNTLENIGNVEFVAGKIGDAARWNSPKTASQVLRRTDNSLNVGSGNFAFSVWFNSSTFNNDPFKIILCYGSQMGGRLFPFVTSDGFLTLGTDFSVVPSINPPLSSNTWYHLVFSRNSGVITAYLNDVELGQFNYTSSIDSSFFLGLANDQQGGTNYQFEGLIDAVGIWRRALSRSEVTALYNTGNGTEDIGNINAIVGPDLAVAGTTQIESINGDGSYDKVSLLLDMEGTTGSTDFIDQSTNSLPVTAFGNTQIVSITGVGTPAAVFDGNGSYLRGNASVNYSNNFTIEGWFCRKAIGNGSVNTIFEAGNIGSGQGGVHLYVESNTEGTFVLNNGFTFVGYAAAGAALNQWVHFAVVRNSGTNTLYINGIAVHTDNQTYSVNNNIFSIGGAPNYGFYINGFVDDFRITEGVARYTSNFIPPSGPLPTTSDPSFANVKLLLNMDNLTDEEIFDASAKDLSLQLFGNVTSSTAETNIRSSSIYFDGNDYIVLEDSGSFELNGNPFCIEAWIYPTQVDSTIRVVVAKDTYGSNFSWCLGFTNSKLLCYTSNINGDWQFEANASVQTNTWQHVAVTFDGTNQRLFLNGQLLGTKAAPITNQPSKITIGCSSWNNPGAHFQGYIDDLRITKGVVRYTSTFTPPAAEFPTTGDTDYNKVSLLLRSNPPVPFVDSSSSNLTITKNGQAKMTLKAPSFSRGNYAVFDGSGDYLQTTIPGWNPGANGEPFTIEFGAIFTNVNQLNVLLSKHGGAALWNGTNGLNFNFFNTNSNNLHFEYWTGSSSTAVSNSVNLQNGRWYHFAIVYNGTFTSVFVDGVQLPTINNNSYGVIPNATTLEIGSQGGGTEYLFNGYISDLRITKGVARYVNNFIPPQTLPLSVGDIAGLKFIPSPAYAVSNETISITHPHTLVYVGKADATAGAEAIFMACQPIKYSQTGNQNVIVFTRPSQSLMPYNGADNNESGYLPDGSEWFYAAFSFLTNNTVRYAIRTPSQTLNGITGGSSHTPFNGYTMFGAGFGNPDAYNVFGTVRAGMFINQAFPTQTDMENLYNDIISGPVSDLGL